MAWYDTIVDIKNTAVDFLKSDTVQDIAGAADYFLGGGDSGKSQQTTIIEPERYYDWMLWKLRQSPEWKKAKYGKPTFKDIGEAGFQNYAALEAYWRYYLTSVGRMSTGTTGGQRRTRRV